MRPAFGLVIGTLVIAMIVLQAPLEGQPPPRRGASGENESIGFSLWPFGQDDDASTGATNSSAQQSADDDGGSWLFRSPLANVTMPEVRLPHYQIFPGLRGDPQKPLRERLAAPLHVFSDGAHFFATNTRRAWDMTRDMIRMPESDRPRLASRDRTPLWKRMLGQTEEEPAGPRTVVEWMAQDRLDP